MFYEGFGKSMKEEIKNYTYMLLCADGTYYTGWTNQIRKRIRAHNSGKGAKYTKGRGPLKLVYLEISDTKEAAMKREAAIKKLTRREKEALIQTEESRTLVREVTEIPFDN
jgi:putative endonuclease